MQSNQELSRLHEIRRYDLRVGDCSTAFDALLRHASGLSGVPSVVLNVIRDVDQWTVARFNWPHAEVMDKKHSFCTSVVELGKPLEIVDASEDPRYMANPYVSGPCGLRYYAGFPVVSDRGVELAALCLVDTVPHRLTDLQKSQMGTLADIASHLLEAHRSQRQTRRIAMIMQAHSKVLQQALAGRALNKVCADLIHGLEQVMPNVRASIMGVTKDRRHLRWVAGPSLPASFARTWAKVEIGPVSMPCGVAAFREKRIRADDIASDEHWNMASPHFGGMGIRSFWTIPLFGARGAPVGTFDLYFDEPGWPTPSECDLIDMLTSTAAIVLEQDCTFKTLVESERQLKEAEQLARLGSFSMHVGTRNRTMSRMANEIVGLPEDQAFITTEDYDRMIHPDDLKSVLHQRESVGRDGKSIEMVYRIFRRSDGELRWVHANGIGIKDGNGQISRYAGVLQDITDKRHAENALRINQRAVDSCSNGVFIIDASLTELPVIYVNAAFEHLTGYSRAEVLGKDWRLMHGSERDQPGLRELRLAIKTQREGHAFLKNTRKDGTEYWIDLRIAPVRDEADTVTHYVGFQTDFTDRIRYERELAHQAGHDSLTGLANRSLLQDRVDQAMLRKKDGEGQVAVVLIDLDRFKLVNDSLGHAAGDLLLKEASQRIAAQVDAGDTVARMGGDEFVVLLHDLGEQKILQQQVDGILAVFDAPFLIDDRTIWVSASAGVALCPFHGDSASALLRNADIAMYHAKSKGRSNSQFYTSALSADSVQKLVLKEELITALRDEQFCVHYQPKIHAQSGKLAGFEALVRWNHPTSGLLFPIDFIDAAEEFGLISELGTWVMYQACRQNKAWLDTNQYQVPVAVNVSASQFQRGTFVADLERVLCETGLEAKYLELEITESVVMESPELFIEVLAKLHAMGIAISVDDFGTGYSSLSFVKQFPIDFLKIDQSFVRDISADPSDAALCETIIAMAHNLGLLVIAEGVETIEQADFLRSRGCDLLQGFLMSKPMPPDVCFGPLFSGRIH
ncbi:MAG: hypothetical protein NVSMB6_22130 [Burkholderiaceae bacterium]